MENCKFTTSRSVKRYKFLFVLAILLSSFLSVYAEDVSNYVEEKTFTFSFENVPLKQVLSHIEKIANLSSSITEKPLIPTARYLLK